MTIESVAEPGVVDRVELDDDAPRPTDCLPPSEAPRATVDLSPGWVAVTDREFLAYHPDRSPAVARVLRANVTGLVLRRAGGRRLLGYVPMAALGAVGSLVVGLLLLSVDPTGFLSLPSGTPADSFQTIVQALAWATNLLGAVLVFVGVLAAFVAVAAVGYWLLSREVVLVFERGGDDPVECPTTRPAGQRALQSLRESLNGLDGPSAESPLAPLEG